MTCTSPTFLSDIVTGFNTFLTWIAILAVPTTALMVGYHALARNADPDPMSATQHQRTMTRSLTSGSIAILSGIAVPAIINAIYNPCATTATTSITTFASILRPGAAAALAAAAHLHHVPLTF